MRTHAARNERQAKRPSLPMLNGSAGFALEATLFVMLLISALIVFAFTGVVRTTRTANLDYRGSRVFYAAEAGAEAVMAQLADALQDAQLSAQELSQIQAPSLPGFTYDQLAVNKIGGVEIETVTDGSFAGLYSLTQRVDISAEARDSMDNRSQIIISAKAQAIPIFQFGIFYEKDLEATNGPSMEFAGWVHSNGNIYLSSNNAWYRDAITTPNKVFWDRKDNHSQKTGVYINDASGNDVNLDFDSRTHPNPNAFRAESDAKFDNRLKTYAYSVDSLKVPLPAGMDPHEVIRPRDLGDTQLEKTAKYSWKADWYIEIPLDQLAGVPALCAQMTSVRPANKNVPNVGDCQNIFTWSWETFYEGRELRYVDALSIDLNELGNWVDDDPSANGTEIMYVTFTGVPFANPATDPSGDGFYPMVRMAEGKELQVGNGFSFATDHPLYIQGDYNRDNWMPAAVISDAITFLSNAWQDSDHLAPVVIKTWASDTWYNVAVLAGHSATPCDHEDAGCSGGYTDFYGGGIENYLRFLERWSNKWTHYQGSLVSLHTSQKALGTWNGTYYSPPKRDWKFDTRFEDPANLPPGTPVVGNVIHTAFRPVY